METSTPSAPAPRLVAMLETSPEMSSTASRKAKGAALPISRPIADASTAA